MTIHYSFDRSFAKPPKPVQVVCECIVVMKGIKEVSWKSAKGMMSEANFLKSLTEMDVDAITSKQTSTVKGLIDYLFHVLFFCWTKSQASLHVIIEIQCLNGLHMRLVLTSTNNENDFRHSGSSFIDLILLFNVSASLFRVSWSVWAVHSFGNYFSCSLAYHACNHLNYMYRPASCEVK